MSTTTTDSPSVPNGQVETLKDFGSDPVGHAAYWAAEIAACDKELNTWRDRGDRVVKRYRDERRDAERVASVQGASKKLNILWSNVETLRPAIYGKVPAPIVERRYKDPDKVARVAGLILERTLQAQIDTQGAFHDALKGVLEDRLLPGMGTVWVRYEEPAQEEAAEAPAQEGGEAAADPDNLVTTSVAAPRDSCKAKVDYVYWRDFGFVPARTWDEVPAVWRRVYMDRDALVKRFGKEIGSEVPLDYLPARHGGNSDEIKNTVFKQAAVYEIWDKRTGLITWLSLAHPVPLDVKQDPIKFPGFFPCPKPLLATTTTGSLVPVPDFSLYQDQADELDQITERLHYLIKALKVVGVYDQENQSLQRIFNEGFENQLIPVDSWAAFAEKGGVKGAVDFVPIQQIIEVVSQLKDVRSQLIQDVYQVTGLADIVRGSSNPNETLGAQKIKAQFASVRLDERKAEMARFVTDVMRLMAHVIVDLFPPEALVEQSCIMESEDGQQAVKDAAAQMQAKAAAAAAAAPPMPGMGSPMPGMGSPNGLGVGQQPPSVGNGQQAVDNDAGALLGASGPSLSSPAGEPGEGISIPGVPEDSVIDEAIELLHGNAATFRIVVAADSLIEPDLDAERQNRNDFLTAITQFLQQAVPAVGQSPELGPLMQALLLWGVRGFRVGRDIEGMIENALNKLVNAPPKPTPPDPKVQALQLKSQLDQRKADSEDQRDQQRFMLEQQRMQNEMAMFKQKMEAEVTAILKKAEADVEAILLKANVTAQTQQQKMVLDAQTAAVQTQATVDANEREFEQQLAHGDAAHQQSLQHGDAAFQQKQAQTAAVPPAAAPKPTGGAK